MGCACTYYPQRQSEDDNRHFAAVVLAFTPARRVRIEYELVVDGAAVKRCSTVSATRLVIGQGEIA